MSDIFTWLQDFGNYEDRKVARDTLYGLTFSTAYSSDEGYETAIIDRNGVHPVERYTSYELAEEGHARWLEKASTIKRVTKLGWLGLLDETPIELFPK